MSRNFTKYSEIPPKADYYHTKVPFAYVEAKKIPGGGYADDKMIRDYVDHFWDFIQKEIEILNPTLIICFDNGECKLAEKIREIPTIPTITSYHPSAHPNYDEERYNRIMNKYRLLELSKCIQTPYPPKGIWAETILYWEFNHQNNTTLVLDLQINSNYSVNLIIKTRENDIQARKEIINSLGVQGEWNCKNDFVVSIKNEPTDEEIVNIISNIQKIISEKLSLV